ncbi:hypothetical protein ABZ815_52085 [Nonomuraea sp. NPDC047529]|uniref:hypothetical protein n=1 Tax=Nonomuraea sp. NPDC047529 TaxID=3155623 RepID=UPI0034004B2F
MSSHECATEVALTEDEYVHFAQVPDGAHELVDTLQCELQADHPGPHLALGQAGGAGGVDWWLRWSATERSLIALEEETGYCETSGPPIDPQGDSDDTVLCQLPSGHFGAHSWQMPSTIAGRVPSAANQQKLIDLADNLPLPD